MVREKVTYYKMLKPERRAKIATKMHAALIEPRLPPSSEEEEKEAGIEVDHTVRESGFDMEKRRSSSTSPKPWRRSTSR